MFDAVTAAEDNMQSKLSKKEAIQSQGQRPKMNKKSQNNRIKDRNIGVKIQDENPDYCKKRSCLDDHRMSKNIREVRKIERVGLDGSTCQHVDLGHEKIRSNRIKDRHIGAEIQDRIRILVEIVLVQKNVEKVESFERFRKT